jgi:hypothetical protein
MRRVFLNPASQVVLDPGLLKIHRTSCSQFTTTGVGQAFQPDGVLVSGWKA